MDATTHTPVLTAAEFATRLVARMFEGRKGHGGGPCSKIVLSREQLANVVEVAFTEGQKTAAPAMLEALEAVDAEGRDTKDGDDVVIPGYVWDLVQAAIADARGE